MSYANRPLTETDFVFRELYKKFGLTGEIIGDHTGYDQSTVAKRANICDRRILSSSLAKNEESIYNVIHNLGRKDLIALLTPAPKLILEKLSRDAFQ